MFGLSHIRVIFIETLQISAFFILVSELFRSISVDRKNIFLEIMLNTE